MTRTLTVLLLLAVLLPAALSANTEALRAVAQAGPTPSLRPYWHVFIAYAVVWLLVGGWIVSIFRRLGRIERRLDRDGE